ncbi:MAG TPA: TolC family protein [Pyrinomonadaceae bacterium]|jgi:HAE1 family hydrophobic/amphiphilic exporter-1|nr:TolC family protein [Pyrinomonadaceae bacterium]
MMTLSNKFVSRAGLTVALLCLLFIARPALAQTTTTSAPVVPAPSGNNPPQGSSAPSTSSGVQSAPSANSPQGQSPAPGSNARPLTPAGQTEQSVQPTTQVEQQNRGTQPVTQPQTPQGVSPNSIPTTDSLQPGLAPPGTSTPAQGDTSPQGPPIAPAQNPRAPGRESVPTIAPDQALRVPSVAQDFATNPAGPLPELNRVGVDMSDQRPLSLREAIAMALENNKDLEVSRDNVKTAEFDLRGARGAYDPRLSSLSYYERSKTPASSFLSGAAGAVLQEDFTGTGRLEGLTPKYGGGYRVDLSAIRLTTNNQFAALNPQFPTALTFNYTQPLLRGLRFDATRRQIEVAKKNLSLTDAQFRQRAIETITSVQRGYWDLVFALRNLQVQQTAVRDARAQLEHNQRLVQEGVLAPIDVVAANAQVSGYEQSVYSALEDVSRAENNLKNLIAQNRQSPFWNTQIIPTDPVDLNAPPVSLPEAMNAAIANRPELKQSDLAREINELDQRLYREQTKPQVDLVGSYGVVGLAGALNANASNPLAGSNAALRDRINELSAIEGLPQLPAPVVQPLPSNLIGSYPQSFLNLAENRYNNFRVGVQVSLPLKNQTAEAQLGRSLVEGHRIQTQREQLEQLIQVDVRNALQSVRTAESRLRAAAIARDASEQQYSSEQRKLDAGQSTVFLVLERQTALTTARGNELRAQTDLNKSIADLQRATGNALEANHVIVNVH